MGLRTGLDYGSVLGSLSATASNPARRRWLFNGIKVIEQAMLGVQRERLQATERGLADGPH